MATTKRKRATKRPNPKVAKRKRATKRNPLPKNRWVTVQAKRRPDGKIDIRRRA